MRCQILHNPYCIHIHEIILHPEEDYLYIILHLYPNGDLQKKIDKAVAQSETEQDPVKAYREAMPLETIRVWAR